MPRKVVRSLKFVAGLVFAGGVWLAIDGREGTHEAWRWAIKNGLFWGGGINGLVGVGICYFLWRIGASQRRRVGAESPLLTIIVWYLFLNALSKILYSTAALVPGDVAIWVMFVMAGLLVLSAAWIVWNSKRLYYLLKAEEKMPMREEYENRIRTIQAQWEQLRAARASAAKLSPEHEEILNRAEDGLRSSQEFLQMNIGPTVEVSTASAGS
jgi:hypothetical protein